MLEDGGLIVSSRKQSEIVEEEAVVGGDGRRPRSRIEDERRGKISRRTGHGDEGRFPRRFQPHQIALLGVVGILRRQLDFGHDRVVVGIDVAQDHAVQRRLLDQEVLQDFVLQQINPQFDNEPLERVIDG